MSINKKSDSFFAFKKIILIGILMIPIIVSIFIRLHRNNKPIIAVITNCAVDFWTIAGRGAAESQKDFAANVEFRMPAFASAADQHRIIEDLVARGVKGIAISPVDAASQTSVLNHIIPNNVYWITQDSDLYGKSKRLCYIGTDNVKAGWRVGKLIREAVPAGGKIVLYTTRIDQLNLQERRQGIIAGIANLPEEKCKSEEAKELAAQPYPIILGKYQILATMTDNVDRDKCYANVVDTFIKHPDVACLAGLCAHNPPAMLLGVQRQKKIGKVKLVGFDEDDITLEGIEDGAIYGTVVQNPYLFGYESVHILDNCIQNNGQLPDKMPKSVNEENLSDGTHFFVAPRVIKKTNNGGLFDMDVISFAADLRQKKGY